MAARPLVVLCSALSVEALWISPIRQSRRGVPPRMSAEEQAKQAWLARLNAPTWGPGAAAQMNDVAGYAATMAELVDEWSAIVDHVIEQCDEGDQVACEVLSNEEAAKQAWLARLDPPGSGWGPLREQPSHLVRHCR